MTPTRNSMSSPEQPHLPKSRESNVDLELSLFLADHGNPRPHLSRSHNAAGANDETVHTADALGWALHQVDATARLS